MFNPIRALVRNNQWLQLDHQKIVYLLEELVKRGISAYCLRVVKNQIFDQIANLRLLNLQITNYKKVIKILNQISGTNHNLSKKSNMINVSKNPLRDTHRNKSNKNHQH